MQGTTNDGTNTAAASQSGHESIMSVSLTRQRTAFLVFGPECSGTRLWTRLLVEAGCIGDYTHEQRWDAAWPTEESPIVWRRSVPHDRRWPDITAKVRHLRARDYRVRAVVTHRDWSATAASQIRHGYAADEGQAMRHIQRAMAQILNELWNSVTPYEIVSYESLVRRPTNVVRAVFNRLGIPEAETLPEIFDGNGTFFDGD